MIETLSGLEAGAIHPRKQDKAQASLAPILKKEDGHLDFSRPAQELYCRLRAFQPWPGAHTRFRGKNLHILKARPTTAPVPKSEMKVVSGRLLVGCGQGTSLELIELQLEGKKRTSAKDFLHGYNPNPGERLGTEQ